MPRVKKDPNDTTVHMGVAYRRFLTFIRHFKRIGLYKVAPYRFKFSVMDDPLCIIDGCMAHSGLTPYRLEAIITVHPYKQVEVVDLILLSVCIDQEMPSNEFLTEQLIESFDNFVDFSLERDRQAKEKYTLEEVIEKHRRYYDLVDSIKLDKEVGSLVKSIKDTKKMLKPSSEKKDSK